MKYFYAEKNVPLPTLPESLGVCTLITTRPLQPETQDFCTLHAGAVAAFRGAECRLKQRLRPRQLRRATMPACSHLVPRRSLLPQIPPSSRPLPTDKWYGVLLLLERCHCPSRAAVPARRRARGLRCRAGGRAQPKNRTQAPVRCQRPCRYALTRCFLLPCFLRHHRCRVSLLPTHRLPTPFVPWLLAPHGPLRHRP